MTAKEDKTNFISHYLEDWIPETKMSETIERLDEVIESYCREQRRRCFFQLKNKNNMNLKVKNTGTKEFPFYQIMNGKDEFCATESKDNAEFIVRLCENQAHFEKPAKLNDSTSEPLPDAYLDNLIKRVEEKRWPNPNESMIEFNRGLEKAIEILRSAPVEVCEWYRSRLIDICYYPDCIKFINSNSIIDRENYIYCPFCGRKIKRI